MKIGKAIGTVAIATSVVMLSGCNFQPFQAQKLVKNKNGTGDLSISNGTFVPPSPSPSQSFEDAIAPFLFTGDVNDPNAAFETYILDGKVYRVDSAKWAARDRTIWVDDAPPAGRVTYVPRGVTLPATPTINSLPQFTTNSQVSLSGGTFAGARVVVYRGDEIAATLPAASASSWGTTVSVSGDGIYSFAARAIDNLNAESLASRTVTITADLSNPFPPVITRALGPLTTEEDLIVEGLTGEAGSTVAIVYNGATNQVTADTTTSGGFSFNAGKVSPPGDYPITITTTAVSGRKSTPRTVTVIVEAP
jgi:hypothetical protein